MRTIFLLAPFLIVSTSQPLNAAVVGGVCGGQWLLPNEERPLVLDRDEDSTLSSEVEFPNGRESGDPSEGDEADEAEVE